MSLDSPNSGERLEALKRFFINYKFEIFYLDYITRSVGASAILDSMAGI